MRLLVCILAFAYVSPVLAEDKTSEEKSETTSIKEQVVDGAESTGKSTAKSGVDAAASSVLGDNMASSAVAEAGKSYANEKADKEVGNAADQARGQLGLEKKNEEAEVKEDTKAKKEDSK